MSNNDNKEWLEHLLGKLNTIDELGQAALDQRTLMQQLKQDKKITPPEMEAFLQNEKRLRRRYSVKQAAQMVGISQTLLDAAEADGRLPSPDLRTDTKRRTRAGYTINQINHMRNVFGKLPSKPKNTLGAIMGVLNLKGGSQKTTKSQGFAHYLAIQGYSVLCFDSDPQATLSWLFGKKPDIDVQFHHTVGPYLLEDDAVLVENGFAPGASKTLDYAVQKTYWDNIDIIPCCLEAILIDLLMPDQVKKSGLTPSESLQRLRQGLHGLAKNYDFIIIDGTPSLNISSLNVISACDMVFVPVPAAMPDFASTIQFCRLIADTIQSYADEGIYINMPDMRYIITKYSKSSYAQYMANNIIRPVFERERLDVLVNESHHSDEVGKASNNTVSIYEINPSEADNRERLKQTVQQFDALFDEMRRSVVESCWSDAEADFELEAVQ